MQGYMIYKENRYDDIYRVEEEFGVFLDEAKAQERVDQLNAEEIGYIELRFQRDLENEQARLKEYNELSAKLTAMGLTDVIARIQRKPSSTYSKYTEEDKERYVKNAQYTTYSVEPVDIHE